MIDSIDSIDSIARVDGDAGWVIEGVGLKTYPPPRRGNPRSIDRSIARPRASPGVTLARTTMASITQSAVLGNVRAFKAAKTTKRCVLCLA